MRKYGCGEQLKEINLTEMQNKKEEEERRRIGRGGDKRRNDTEKS